ncbi:MAG: 5-demethoxyubiquinol-8 5-hydroxylase UbiM [Thiotrichales bacterium]|jgi:ubiquinone biosynthesis UbiH/UbiF/VisC/COQ6 family hydroxylase|nr:5-demethoxyubiquinol-8 5-hydroxylase UbiM [Thiotrichales bacterium]MBT3614012.1 5-demethoxyubiquinol-8 5-hydroxylase UbiM [Thiotrichales bacterium]MBT3752067.1 5-demethoxyubiquinol-8 5-hydroxylase UbiM [Thiotrichales bacterium]MBT3836781.1 5-demethoxyubiquinol-8 5-hydroxylase UbiM [Thiotrichales bacterium]MBT4151555.1 5-demethoxyubiquinol-8 5-hydroxylase UbiM [Thiotrichales bacterium]
MNAKLNIGKMDVIVIGGGAAGLSFGCSLANTKLRVLILERQGLESISNPQMDGRDFANTHLSKKVMQKLGVWERIPKEEIALLREAKVVDGDSDYALQFDASSKQATELGYLISNHIIRKALYDQLVGAENVDILTEVEVSGLESNQSGATVTLSTGEKIGAEMVVSADSRFSATRKMMGISAEMFDFGRTAIVCRVTHEKPHHETAFECFRYGRTLALLPLNGKRGSVVITVPSNQAQRYLEMSVDEFNREVEEGLAGEFGKVELESERFSYPLVAVHANRFVGERYALLGDAAVGMHPVTAHGFNLGLRGQDSLSFEMIKALERGEPLYSKKALENYERKQMIASRPIYHGTNAIVRLFTSDNESAKLLRKAALRFGNNFPPVQWAIIHKLTEIGGISGFATPKLDKVKESVGGIFGRELKMPKFDLSNLKISNLKIPKYSTR